LKVILSEEVKEMRVYDGLNHIADVTELTRVEIVRLQGNVRILALQRRSSTADFLKKYADVIVKSIQFGAEAIDDNGLEVCVVFPMIGGSAIKVVFTGVNMDREKYIQLKRALMLKIADIAGRYYRRLGRCRRGVESNVFQNVAEACEDMYSAVEREYTRHSYQKQNSSFVTRVKSYEKDSELCLFG